MSVPKLCWIGKKKRLLFTVKHLNIRITRKFVLMIIQKQGFRHKKKTEKSHKTIKMSSKTNFMSDLV